MLAPSWLTIWLSSLKTPQAFGFFCFFLHHFPCLWFFFLFPFPTKLFWISDLSWRIFHHSASLEDSLCTLTHLCESGGFCKLGCVNSDFQNQLWCVPWECYHSYRSSDHYGLPLGLVMISWPEWDGVRIRTPFFSWKVSTFAFLYVVITPDWRLE